MFALSLFSISLLYLPSLFNILLFNIFNTSQLFFVDDVTWKSFTYLDEAEEGSSKCGRKKKKYPKWNAIHDLKQKLSLELELKFTNPTEFKDAPRFQDYMQFKKGLTILICTIRKIKCRPFARGIVIGGFMHPEWMIRRLFRSKLSLTSIIVHGKHYDTTIIKGQQSNGLHKDIWTTFETKTTKSINIERVDTTKKTLFYNVFLTSLITFKAM